MSKLEYLQPNEAVRGILTCCLVIVISLQWFCSEALDLTYKTHEDKPANELLYRHDENRIEVIEQGRTWSFNEDRGIFRMALEAHLVRLAHMFDPILAVRTSMFDLLPHQINAVYDAVPPHQLLHFQMADDRGAGKTIMSGLLIRKLLIWSLINIARVV